MKNQLLNGISFLLRVFTGTYTWLRDRTLPGAISAEDDALPVPWYGLIAKSPEQRRQISLKPAFFYSHIDRRI